jgi:Arm DNA-binding domain
VKLDARTTSVLRELPVGKLDVIHFDDSLIGFGLRLRRDASGKRVLRSWIAQYRASDTGRTRRLKIGDVAKVTAADAREAARKALAKVALGGIRKPKRLRVGNTTRCPTRTM